jgi:hypothetical protein
MKILLGWLCDPYLHVILIGLLLGCLAMTTGTNEPARAARPPVFCERCLDYHESGDGGCRLACALASLFQSR